jgi:hypothetical protein
MSLLSFKKDRNKKQRKLWINPWVMAFFAITLAYGILITITIVYPDSLFKFRYNIAERYIKQDQLFKSINYQCSVSEDPLGCIIRMYDEMPVEFHKDRIIRTASKIKEEGGVCRDFSVNICASLEELGYSCEYFITDDHVLPIINRSTNYLYCREVGYHWLYCD